MKQAKLSATTAAFLAAMSLVLTLAACSEKQEVVLSEQQATAMTERLAPAGEVTMASDVASAPAASSGPQSGEDVYNSKCSTCHTSGAAGAPKLGAADEWADRIGKGIDVLYTSAISGFNGMPPKGLCFSCSDDELKAAVDYMVEGSQ